MSRTFGGNIRCIFAFGSLAAGLFMPIRLAGQANSGPFINSVNNAADYGTSIAPGSIFVIFGAALGPINLTEISSLPLPPQLVGTAVTVTSGNLKLTCPMIYTSYYQVAAVLPNEIPLGNAMITVSYNGHTDPAGFSTLSTIVAASAPGLFTPNSTGLGPGSITAQDGSLITFANSAQPTQVVTAWGTGLGAVAGPDNAIPTSFPSFSNAQVWVGGQAAPFIYAGRSGCCVGLDQISFTVPPGVSGCNVTVMVVSGGIPSNTVSMAVNSGGGQCANTGPAPPGTTLTKATAGQPIRVAAITVSPSAASNRQLFARSLATRLSAALHTRVPVSDATRLIRAYRDKNPEAIRDAMAKYSSKWQSLNPQTRASLTSQMAQAPLGAVAEFGTLTNEGLAASMGGAEVPTPGACVTLPQIYPQGLGSHTTPLDAGPYLGLTGAAGTFLLNKTQTGHYSVVFGSSVTGPAIPLGTYSITSNGGTDVHGFSASLTVSSHLAISNKAALATIDRTQPQTITWTGGVAGSYILIGGYGPAASPDEFYNPHAEFVCVEDGGKGSFTIPSYMFSVFSVSTTRQGILGISPHPLSNPITIPGIDLAYFVDGSSDTVTVNLK